MPRTIATASNVFAACDRLEAANERWNREDVRSEVGGGGWGVIASCSEPKEPVPLLAIQYRSAVEWPQLTKSKNAMSGT